MLNLAINIRSAVPTAEIVTWFHNIADAITGIAGIGRVVALRLVPDSINTAETDLVNQISPQMGCFQFMPRVGTAASHDSMGWWWNVGLHNAFAMVPAPDYVLHYPFDVDWSRRDGNSVIHRHTFKAFADCSGDHDLIVGTFTASDPNVASSEHTKNRIEDDVLRKIQAAFPNFHSQRPRSEFFAVRREFFFDFDKAVAPEQFFNDLTVQLLLFAHRKGRRVSEVPIGSYYVRNDEYTADKVSEQVGRIERIIEWAKTV